MKAFNRLPWPLGDASAARPSLQISQPGSAATSLPPAVDSTSHTEPADVLLFTEDGTELVGAGRLAHQAFFERVSQAEDDSAPSRAATAGLLTLRLVDRWVAATQDGDCLSQYEVAAVDDVVQVMDPSDARNILNGVVGVLGRGGARMSDVLARLMAYATSLRFDAAWAMAADVYHTVIALGLTPGAGLGGVGSAAEPELAEMACFDLGYCRRQLGDLDAAGWAYMQGRTLAARRGNAAGVLRAQISDANLSLHRGNLPEAEAMLDGAIRDAEACGWGSALSRALHDRAHVAALRGEYERSAVFGLRALQHCGDPTERDRILSDIAAALMDGGHREAARNAHLVLAATARDQVVRWAATINLLELAVLDGSEPLFERYRRELAEAALPPALAASYHLHAGDGCRRFGRPAAARAAYRRVAALAGEFALHQFTALAEDRIRDLARDPEPPASAAPSAPAREIDAVIAAMSEMRDAAIAVPLTAGRG